MINPILNVDSYKASHFLQYPPHTTCVSSYIESRGGEFQQSVFFGLQMFIKQYLSRPISQGDIDEAQALLTAHGLPFNKAGWMHILNRHQGKLPLEIQAVPEGTLIDTSNVLVQVKNTDPECAWLTSYVETALLRAIWYPTTVATLSWQCKQLIASYMQDTSETLDGLEFKLHDFGARGTSSEETAAIGGAAHLLNFMGSDTLNGIVAARRYYDADMPGFSIPAAEHSTITSWGKEGEVDAYANMLEHFSGKDKLVAVVSDSYDLWNAIDNIWGTELKERIEQSGGTLVIRPDSGDPVTVVTQTLEKLMRHFGYITNKKGYRELPPYIRIIQGDGISLHTIGEILAAMKEKKQSASNVTFGMGGELLQKINRDTMQFAMKASAARVEGIWRDIYKDPITDQGKRSKKGRLALIKDKQGKFKTIREQDLGNRENLLRCVFKDGELVLNETFEQLRTRLQSQTFA